MTKKPSKNDKPIFSSIKLVSWQVRLWQRKVTQTPGGRKRAAFPLLQEGMVRDVTVSIYTTAQIRCQPILRRWGNLDQWQPASKNVGAGGGEEEAASPPLTPMHTVTYITCRQDCCNSQRTGILWLRLGGTEYLHKEMGSKWSRRQKGFSRSQASEIHAQNSCDFSPSICLSAI